MAVSAGQALRHPATSDVTDSPTTPAPEAPPLRTTTDGRPRRVGVEIEFGGLDADAAAEVVQGLYGGTIEAVDRHKSLVRDTAFGMFTVELDSTYAHPKAVPADDKATFQERLKSKLAPTVGDVVSLWLPYEVVAPPVAFDRLGELDDLVAALRRRGASGTQESPLYAFGLQLNPEVAASDVGYILCHLRAYLVLSPWLRAEIGIDPSRRLLPFAAHFPQNYVRHVLDPHYAPDLDALIGDYLEANPTRNRELDLLPLFAHLDPDKVHRAVPDPLIKARPTFHYRLPNSRIGDPEWGGVVGEWNRWVKVERLAADRPRLEEAARQYCAELDASPLSDFVERARQWVAP